MRINPIFSFLSVFFSLSFIGHGGIIKVTETGIGGDAPAIIAGNFGEESLSFSDRTHQHNGAAFDFANGSLSISGTAVIGLPDYLIGGDYIRFANNARENNPYSALVEADGPTTWYLLVDNRLDGFARNTSNPNYTDPGMTCFKEHLQHAFPQFNGGHPLPVDFTSGSLGLIFYITLLKGAPVKVMEVRRLI